MAAAQPRNRPHRRQVRPRARVYHRLPDHHRRRAAPGAPRRQGGAAGDQRHRQDHAAVDPAARAKRCSSTWRPAISPSRAGPATRSGHAPGTSAATSPCSSAAPTRRCGDDQAYSQAHYDAVCERFGDPAVLDRYETIFVDSITVAGRLCFQWCKGQPEAISEKTGRPDIRGTYGLHGREMIGWLTQLQHTRGQERLVRRDPRREVRRLQPPLLRAADRWRQDRQRAARHRRRGHHHGRDPGRRRVVLPRLRLPHAQSLGVSGEGPLGPARHDRRAAPGPADGEDPRPREAGAREDGVWPPRLS